MADTEKDVPRRNPNVWVPTLYYTQGFPLTVVTEMATVFFKAMQVSNEALGVFQGIFNLPWAFKFIWSPMVDMFSTKRRWILAAQALLALMFIGVTALVFLPQTAGTATFRIVMPDFAVSTTKELAVGPLHIPLPRIPKAIWPTLMILVFFFSAGFGMDPRRRAGTRGACLVLALATAALFVIFRSPLFMSNYLTLPMHIWVAFSCFFVIAMLSATHDIGIDGYYLDVLDKSGQAAFSGIRVAFYRVAMVVGGGLLVMLAGSAGWALAFGIGAAVFLALFVFHTVYLSPGLQPAREAKTERKSFVQAFSTYLDQKRILLILLFIIFFRVGDFLWKPMAKPFLMDIGVTVKQIGFIYGTLGIIATILGSILGGIYIARRGLTRGLWTLGIIQSVTLLLYAYLAHAYPKASAQALAAAPASPDKSVLPFAHLVIVGAVNTFENLAYGLGTIAFVNFLMRTCKKEYTAAHYAIATGLMALASTISSFYSGFMMEKLGYTHFFVICFAASIPGLIILAFLPIREMEGAEQ